MALQSFDGPPALAVAELEHPEPVILDWMLPGLDGLEVSRLLRIALFRTRGATHTFSA